MISGNQVSVFYSSNTGVEILRWIANRGLFSTAALGNAIGVTFPNLIESWLKEAERLGLVEPWRPGWWVSKVSLTRADGERIKLIA
jgi:hypothetical protein